MHDAARLGWAMRSDSSSNACAPGAIITVARTTCSHGPTHDGAPRLIIGEFERDPPAVFSCASIFFKKSMYPSVEFMLFSLNQPPPDQPRATPKGRASPCRCSE